ncbi:hypothetical protein V8T57_005634, partial [Bacillus wiedmannii]
VVEETEESEEAEVVEETGNPEEAEVVEETEESEEVELAREIEESKRTKEAYNWLNSFFATDIRNSNDIDLEETDIDYF